MKRFIGSFAAKTTAVILLFISIFIIAVSAVGVIVLAKYEVYTDGGRIFKNSLLDNAASYYEGYLYRYADEIMFPEYYGEFNQNDFNDRFFEQNCNYFFTLKNSEGQVILTNGTTPSSENILRDYGNQTLRGSYVDHNAAMHIAISSDTNEFQTPPKDETVPPNYIYDYTTNDENGNFYEVYVPEYSYELTLYSGIRSNLSAKDRIYYSALLADTLIQHRYTFVLLIPLLFIVCILLLIFLICSAGHRQNSESIHLNFIDRIPFDLYLVSIAVFVLGCIYIVDEILFDDFWMAILAILSVPLSLAILLTIATRIKTGTLYQNLIITRILHRSKKILKYFATIISQLSLYWKIGTVWAIYSAVELCFYLKSYETFLIWFWVFKTVIGTALIVATIIPMQKLREAGRELANGNIHFTVDTKDMLPVFKEHGDHLNGIGEGLSLAVEKEIRSERMRTELITNVSHDLKTPLTSIINYVDLLKIEGLNSSDAPSYLDVLDRQSARLKKLTEDLIEASKASSGAIRVQLAPLDVSILLQQATAEYEERFRTKALELITNHVSANVYISADGRLLWRVFDNLFSNIVKYSKRDTRVYVVTEHIDQCICITFKSISNEPLNISPDELTERFVRGDTSRNTEGSGLGLSIAKSLVELQGGTFEIHIDGDLFKTVITLPELENER